MWHNVPRTERDESWLSASSGRPARTKNPGGDASWRAGDGAVSKRKVARGLD